MADIPSTMQAVVLTGPGEFEIKEVPTPQPEGDEVLCRVHAVAICGTDPKIVKGAYPGMWPKSYPFIIGHEWAGEIVAITPQIAASPTLAKKYAVGTRVAGEAHKGCGVCQNCLEGRYTICLNYGDQAAGHRHYGFTSQGAYATYVKVSIKALHPLPEGLSYDHAAMLDAAGVSLHGVLRGGVSVGHNVAVTGPGPVGNLSMQFAKAAGAKQVVVVGRGARLQQAVELGAVPVDYEKVEDPVKKVWELCDGVGADVVIECAGTKVSCEQSVMMARKGGKVVMAALASEPITIPWTTLTLAEVDLIGVRANPNTNEQALALMANGTVNAGSILTHTFPLEKFGEALETFVERRGGAMKVVLHP